MFKRSRKKIILSIMGPLILLFALTLTVIMMASWREIRQKNTDMLRRFSELYFPERQEILQGEDNPEQDQGPAGIYAPEAAGPDTPGAGEQNTAEAASLNTTGAAGTDTPLPDEKEGPPRLDLRPDYRLSTFYSVALEEDGTVLAVDNGEKDVYSEEDLTAIAEKLLAGKKRSGRSGNLSYLISDKGGYTLVAFMDNTLEESSMNTLLRNFLIVGSAAIVILFFLSLYLANLIIRPLEENDRKQKQFISDASHELKTPVAVIGANAELLTRELGGNEWLANIQYENERMGSLVMQLLDLSRAENAEVPMEKVDFSRVVTGETLAFESLAFDQGKMIQTDIEEGIQVTGNEGQLTQLVSVLLDNAVRHSTGSEIEVTLRSRSHAAELCVANEGDEIPPEKLEHLFDRFYRLDEARNSETQHYGLGLSIAKAAAEKHGGNISVSCRDGKIRFTVTLPHKS